MTTDRDHREATTLPPDDAFSTLGNETRMEILQTLGAADEPLSFTELHDRVGTRDSGQFNYHLSKLEGNFVQKADAGYTLRQAGRRVIEAVLSGAVTETVAMEPTPIDEPCPLCDAATVVAYYQERVEHFCTECPGHYGVTEARSKYATTDEGAAEDATYGYLGSVPLPPAGLKGRSPTEIFEISSTWGVLELLAVASGVCPRCSATLNESLRICEAHETTDGLCAECQNRHAVHVNYRCSNCLYEQGGAFVLALMADLELLAFLIDHGINPIVPSTTAAYDAVVMDYEEDLRSVDPFEARFTFTIDDDSLTLAVDADLDAVAVPR